MTPTSVYFLDDNTFIALDELTQASGLHEEQIAELVEFGVFEPRRQANDWMFSARCIVKARQAARLQRDFELDSAGLALALTYLERIESLEHQLRQLECQLLRE